MSHRESTRARLAAAAGAVATQDIEIRRRSGIGQAIAEVVEAERARWFLWLPVWLGAGIGVYFWLPAEPTYLTTLSVAGAAIALLFLVRVGPAGAVLVPMIAACGAGFVLAKARTEWTRAPVLERQLTSADVRGLVELVEPRPGKGERLTIRVSSIDEIASDRLPYRVRIRTLQVTPGLKPGDSIRIRAKLGPPSPPSLPDDYDFARAAWFQKLGATGFAMSKAEVVARADGPAAGQTGFRISQAIENLRQVIGRRVTAELPGDVGAIANALITGERGAISEEATKTFRDSGLLHILSISGLHMVVMAGAAFFGIRLILSAFPRLVLYYAIKKWAAVAALAAAFGYLMISGSSVATLRSAIMIAIIFLAVLADRPAIAMRNVAIAALILLATMPETLLDAGFQMSFAAVICLVAVYESLRLRASARELQPFTTAGRLGAFFGGIVLSTLIASVAVAPFAIYHFHQTQQFAVAANLVAIPICNVIVMPAALLTLLAMPFGFEALPLAAMGKGIEAMIWAAEAVAGVPGAVGHVAAVPQISLVLFTLGGLWLTLWQTRWRFAGLALIAVAALFAPAKERPDIIAGRDGLLVLGRGPDGALAATAGRQGGFELDRWLAQDGDSRPATEAADRGLWSCDAAGCVGTVKGVTVASARHPSALPEDCRRARILVLSFPKPAGCAGPDLIIDKLAFQNHGTHTVSIGNGAQLEDAASQPKSRAPHHDLALRIGTVAQHRGDRPWTVSLRGHRNVPAMQSRLKPAGTARATTSSDSLDVIPSRRSLPVDDPE